MDIKLNRLFFRNRLARKILFLFVSCALAPILLFAWYAYGQIGLQMSRENQNRLTHLAKVMGMSIYERLVLLDVELSHVASGVLSGVPYRDYSDDGRESSESGFDSICLVSQDGTSTPLRGTPTLLPKPAVQSDDTKTAIIFLSDDERGSKSFPRVYLSRLLYRGTGIAQWVIGEVKLETLWGIGEFDIWPALTDFCVLDRSDRVLVSSLTEGRTSGLVEHKHRSEGSRQFEWRHSGVGYQAACWPIFLRSRFESEDWSIVMSQSKAKMLEGLSQFKFIFFLMTLLSLALVMYLSVRYIQKSFIALEHLREGTVRISSGDFTSSIVVESGDEIEELAHSFNSMSHQVGRQIKLLSTRSSLDRSLLSSLELPRIARTLQETLARHYEHISVRVVLMGNSVTEGPPSLELKASSSERGLYQKLRDHEAQLAAFFRNHEYWVSGDGLNLPEAITSSMAPSGRQILIVPVFSNLMLAAVVITQIPETVEWTPEDCRFARQLADQTGIAMANAHTLSRLDQHNWETMHALARAVDANSPWTAGHSDRVTHLTMTIAEQLDMSRQELENLHRAALLHDVGKLGIPSRVLNKPDKLTDEEFELIKSHPGKGATILEPICSYAAMVPIISQHHERFDGKGYPLGLRGEAICQGARIIAVADSFDAMVSDRPYRKGMSREQALRIIRDEAGSQFDPGIVNVFLQVADTCPLSSNTGDEQARILSSELPNRNESYSVSCTFRDTDPSSKT